MPVICPPIPLANRLDQQRKLQTLWATDLSIHGKHGKARHLKSVIGKDHFRQCFVVGQGKSARVATRVGLFHQLQITHDVLVVERIAMKFLEQIKRDVGFVLHQRVSDDIQ